VALEDGDCGRRDSSRCVFRFGKQTSSSARPNWSGQSNDSLVLAQSAGLFFCCHDQRVATFLAECKGALEGGRSEASEGQAPMVDDLEKIAVAPFEFAAHRGLVSRKRILDGDLVDSEPTCFHKLHQCKSPVGGHKFQAHFGACGVFFVEGDFFVCRAFLFGR
jgi:hypothetical protein